ncbi:hypothetical protein [Robertkochia sediminum]|uniref:hypothetical protein n=1 Tax=Robertkochia sediminum TaxID=2785326 RepID=UPI001932E8D1|nr:hypothetical protein [Robertkochia sediminum]MBL7471222.1 hypothetical protein [Robertkochia sediminum]
MNKSILLLATFLFAFTFSQAQDKFKIFRENQSSKHELGINKFYFVHHTFADSFFMMDLHKILDYDEMSQILLHVYNGVTTKEKVNVEYTLKKPSDARVAYFFKEVKDNDSLFIMMTNFNKAKRKFEPKPKAEDQLARWYYIKGEKLVYRKDLYSQEEEAKRKNGDATDIIGYYLFDDNYENDKLIKPLIEDVLNNNQDKLMQFYATLYLMEYHLLQNELEYAEKALNELKASFENNIEISRSNKLIIDMATAEYEVMKRI